MPHRRQRRQVVIGIRLVTPGKLDRFLGNRLVENFTQQMTNAIEARPPFVIRVDEALAACTATPVAVHQAMDLGVFAVGNRADLAILSENILAAEPSRIADVRVDIMISNRTIVHRGL
jgi:predicted amidohydrolase YtcJ